MFVLDTDLLTLAFRGRGDDAERLRKRLKEVPAKALATTVVNYEEQMRGWIGFAAKAKSVTQQVDAYRRLESHLDDFRTMPLVSFTEAAAVEFQRLQKMRLRVGTMDLRIAAIALASRHVLLSRNMRDFSQVPSLKVEDWST